MSRLLGCFKTFGDGGKTQAGVVKEPPGETRNGTGQQITLLRDDAMNDVSPSTLNNMAHQPVCPSIDLVSIITGVKLELLPRLIATRLVVLGYSRHQPASGHN